MNKVELFEIYQKHDHADSEVWEAWFEWRLKQLGCERHVGKDDPGYEKWHTEWLKLLHTMPTSTGWRPTSNNTMIVSWGDGEEHDEFPLDMVIENLDKEPDLEMKWHSGYWDGPLTGMAKYNDEEVWFSYINDFDAGDRTFGLYRLTDEDRTELTRHHDLFCELVGKHCNHHPDEFCEFQNDDDTCAKFYDIKFPEVDGSKGEKLAEVHWYQFKYWSTPR